MAFVHVHNVLQVVMVVLSLLFCCILLYMPMITCAYDTVGGLAYVITKYVAFWCWVTASCTKYANIPMEIAFPLDSMGDGIQVFSECHIIEVGEWWSQSEYLPNRYIMIVFASNPADPFFRQNFRMKCRASNNPARYFMSSRRVCIFYFVSKCSRQTYNLSSFKVLVQ